VHMRQVSTSGYTKTQHEMRVSMHCFSVSAAESLINSHIYVPDCMTSELVLPGLCNCDKENSCGRVTIGEPTIAVLFDTDNTFVCANIIALGFVYSLAMTLLSLISCFGTRSTRFSDVISIAWHCGGLVLSSFGDAKCFDWHLLLSNDLTLSNHVA